MKKIISRLLTTTAITTQCQAADIKIIPREGDLGVFITIEGHIDINDDDKFNTIILALPTSTKKLVKLNSLGGIGIAGLIIGGAVRNYQLNTYVASGDTCTSACADIWLGGVKRYAGQSSRIGFHSAYNAETHQVTGPLNALSGAYYARIGLNYDAIIFATKAGPDQIAWLTFEEAKRIGIEYTLVPDNVQEAREPKITIAPIIDRNRSASAQPPSKKSWVSRIDLSCVPENDSSDLIHILATFDTNTGANAFWNVSHNINGAIYDRSIQYTNINKWQTQGKFEWFWSGVQQRNPQHTLVAKLGHWPPNNWIYQETHNINGVAEPIVVIAPCQER